MRSGIGNLVRPARRGSSPSPPRVMSRIQRTPLLPKGQEESQGRAVAPDPGLEPEIAPRRQNGQAVLSERAGQDDLVAGLG